MRSGWKRNIGKKAKQMLFSIFIETANQKNDKLVETTQNKLRQTGFFLPFIGRGIDSNLSKSVFKITYSFHQEICALSDIEGVLHKIAMDYPFPASGAIDALALVNSGNTAFFMNGDYNSALFFYDKAYYLLVHFGQPSLYTPLINAAINIIYIHYTEAKIPQNIMQLLANLTAFVESNDFHDPLLRYNVHFLYANVLWLTEHYEEAVIFWEKSVDDVRNASAPELTMLALHSIVDAYAILQKDVDQNYITTLQLMRSIIPFQDQKNLIADILLAIKDRQIELLMAKNAELINQNAQLNQLIVEQRAQIGEAETLSRENAELRKKLKNRNFWDKAVMIAHGLLVIITPFLPLPGVKSPLVQFGGKLITRNQFTGNSSVFRVDRG